jgi:hypothetical protein
LSNYQYYYVFTTENLKYVKEFYDLLDQYKEKIEKWKIKHNFQNIDLGDYNKLVSHVQKILLEKRKQPVTKLSLNCSHYEPAKIGKCKIDFRKSNIKFSEIYRVYGKNKMGTYMFKSVDTICNWGGKIIDEDVLNHLKPGNVVRLACWKMNGAQFGIYVTLLEKLSEKEFLVIVKNYNSNFDNIVFIVHINSIMEVPCDWFSNKNLEKFDEGKDFGDGEKKGFAMTGNTYDHEKTVTLEGNWDNFTKLLVEMDYDL